MASSCFLNNPEPLHGASTIITSKKFGNLEKSCGSLLVTILFIEPHLAILCVNTGTLVLITSLLTNKLSSFSKEANKVLLPPGAAQASNTINSFDASTACVKACSTNIDEASCT